MRFLKYTTGLVLAAAVGLAACSDDSESNGGEAGAAGDDAGVGGSSGGASGAGGAAGGTAGGGTAGSGVGGAGTAGVAGGPTCSHDGNACTEGTECCSGKCEAGLCTTDTVCGLPGDACTGGGDCCSQKCEGGECQADIPPCKNAGADCSNPTECCSLRCEGQKCQGSACVQNSQTCGNNTECCSGWCDGGNCRALPTNCGTTIGNACTEHSQCCSKLCVDGKCAESSFCTQQGDVCDPNRDDCCSGVCNPVTGSAYGTCGAPPSAPANCGGVTGTACSSCGQCCSRLCAPHATTGVYICQPPSGCRVTGELCKDDDDCCGGPNSGGFGQGNVRCDKAAGAEYGRCRNPQSCTPQGNICHFQDYNFCGNSTSSNSCCGDLNKKLGFCQLDSLGIPRCTGNECAVD
jgi:hypothetical protein